MRDMSQKIAMTERGQRPVRVANCAGAMSDQGSQMLKQIVSGDVDFVTGDYLAELTLPANAEGFAAGAHPGFEPTAWDGLSQSMEQIAKRSVKVIINGGALNPLGLAQKCQDLAESKGYSLKIAAVVGDDVLASAKPLLEAGKLPYLDGANPDVKQASRMHVFKDTKLHPLVSAHAYLGSRGIIQALNHDADVIICGRVADAAPVIAAARWWHSWADTSYDEIAGSLIAGHLIECSAYVTGANFTGWDEYKPEDLLDLGFGIAEIDKRGACVITKHETLNGFVTEDTVKSQLLYEIQGDTYLNSDVKAHLQDIVVQQVGPNRVGVSGARGAPPPETTKLAVSYKAGYQSQFLINLAGYAWKAKHEFYKNQIRHGLSKAGMLDAFDNLDFQCIGVAEPNPSSMHASTVYFRIFSSAPSPAPIGAMLQIMAGYGMQVVSGAHGSTDFRTAAPKPYLGYFPALYPQNLIEERAVILGDKGAAAVELPAGHPPQYEPVSRRANYDADSSATAPAYVGKYWGTTTELPLGDIALGRSGDKGANVSMGLFVKSEAMWEWFRVYISRSRLQELMGEDWRDEYFIERVEFPRLRAVHFVVYGLLERGVSSTASLDSLGKGFVDFIRARHVQVPLCLLRQG